MQATAGVFISFITSLSPFHKNPIEEESEITATIESPTLTDVNGNILERITKPKPIDYKTLADYLTEYSNGNKPTWEDIFEVQEDIISFSNELEKFAKPLSHQFESTESKPSSKPTV